MGRLSRHKKIKSCDPFFKGSKNVNISSVNAPVSQLDNQPVPRKAKNLFVNGGHLTSKVRKGRIEKKLKKGNLDITQKPDETQGEYCKRLDRQTAEKVNMILLKEKHVSQKRKEFLKARKLKRNKRGNNVVEKDCEKDFVTCDNIKFGEVVKEPPHLKTTPKLKMKYGRHGNVESLLLNNKISKEIRKSVEEQKLSLTTEIKKRKHMNILEKQKYDKTRLNAIEAYRKNKKKHLENT